LAESSEKAGGPQDVRVRFARSGGIAGVTLPLEPEELEPEEVIEVEGMLAGVDLEELARRPRRPGGADRFTYELEVERGGERHAVTLSEEEVPEDLKPALQRLTKLAIEKRRAKGRGA
jgi:hypothetical protein